MQIVGLAAALAHIRCEKVKGSIDEEWSEHA